MTIKQKKKKAKSAAEALEKIMQIIKPYMPRADVPPLEKPQKWKLPENRMKKVARYRGQEL